MKRTIFALAAIFCVHLCANAQIMRTEELEDYAKEKYGEKWVDAATNLGSQLSLDKNNAITYTQVIQCPGKSSDQLYVLLNYWFTATFNDANSVIQLNDKDLGTIIAKGYVSDIAAHAGGTNTYNVSLEPVIKVDIKEEKIRVTYTVPYYTVLKMVGGGIMGALGGSPGVPVKQKWLLDECFPFTKEKDSHKKTSSKALVMAHAYSNVIMDKIEEAVKNGLTGNEGDDW